jgi:hypothetical protein
MNTTYGIRHTEAPKNMAREIHFPSMATMDKATGDGRKLASAGQGVRDLPRTIYAQFAQAEGHMESVIVGSLTQVEFHDDGNVSGYAWLLDDENGSKMAYYLESGAFRHNSIDLAEVKVELDIVEGAGGMFDFEITFTEWKIAATTFVGKPAFADAYAELTASAVDELRSGEPLVWEGDVVYRELTPELTASLALDDPTAVDRAAFYRPEAETAHKIIVGPRRDDGRCEVYGCLGLWTDPGPRKPPRPRDNYASFNQPSVLTFDGDHVETGPVFFQGGHPDHPLGRTDPAAAYGGVENAWADVRVTEGVHGPWISGLTRPGVSDEVIYAARASRISGHWVGNDLRAIVSVNVPRFNIVGSGMSTGAIAWSTDADGRTLELVASFPNDDEPADPDDFDVRVAGVVERVLAEREAARRAQETADLLALAEAIEEADVARLRLELQLLDDD